MYGFSEIFISNKKKKDCYFVVLYITGNLQIIGKQSELCFTVFVILDNFTL